MLQLLPAWSMFGATGLIPSGYVSLKVSSPLQGASPSFSATTTIEIGFPTSAVVGVWMCRAMPGEAAEAGLGKASRAMAANNEARASARVRGADFNGNLRDRCDECSLCLVSHGFFDADAAGGAVADAYGAGGVPVA